MTADFGGLRMKHVIKIIALISVLCLVLGVFSGCGSEGNTSFGQFSEMPSTMENLKSGKVAENGRYTMSWNKGRAAILITDKKSGTVWSTTPYDYLNRTTLDDVGEDTLKNSSLSITIRTGSQMYEYFAVTSCVMNGTYASEKIKNGIRITYYFMDISLSVTTDYYLAEDGFKVEVDPAKIGYYGGDNWVYKVTPAPFICAGKNTENESKDSYFVIPSGSGALMYLDERSDQNARVFEANVYGHDYAMDAYTNDANETPVTMPFYGMKSGNQAICAIIENAAESCSIEARVGDAAIDYGYLNATYQVIGENQVYLPNKHRLHYNEFAERELDPLVIGYYPLSGSNANYVGIAKRYQKFLVQKKGMKKSQDNSLLTVKLLGSYVEDDLFLGLPTKKEVSLTSYEEATNILGELNNITGGSLTAQMYAYGQGGLNAEKMAGNYKLTGVTGNKRALKDFVSFANEHSIKTFFDFNTVVFSKSGSGFSTKSDSATAANGVVAPVHQFWPSTRVRYSKPQGGTIGAMIVREKLGDATLKTVSVADKYGITGLSYSTLGSIAYSDYTAVPENKRIGKYPLRNNMDDDVTAIVKEVQSNSKTVMVDGAFGYAAASADVLANCPTASELNQSFDREVPLYQIVFQGYKANSVSPINTAVNRNTQFLKAIETGSGLSFMLMANYYTELRKQYDRGLYAALYSDNKDYIANCVEQSKGYLSKVAGATITGHEWVTDSVVRTTFSNGVRTYVNYGDKNYVSDIGTVKANGFLTK